MAYSPDRRRRINEVLDLLFAKFPRTFYPKPRHRKLLKVGISHDLEAALGDSVDRTLLHQAIKFYVFNRRYLRAVRVGAERIDLDGKVAGVATAEEEASARDTHAALEAKRPKKQQQKVEYEKKKRDGLAALREAAARRRQVAEGAA